MPFNNFAHSSLGAVSSDPLVAQAQQLLNQLGYSLTVDGIWGSKTQGALQAVWMSLGKQESIGAVDASVIAALTQAVLNKSTQGRFSPSLVPPLGTAMSLAESTATPFWKAPLFIGLGAVSLAVVAYIAINYESKAEPVKRVKALSGADKKCGRTPDFDDGEPMDADDVPERESLASL